MDKLDFKKLLKPLYSTTGKAISIVEVPPLNFLSIEGSGSPEESQDFKDASDALVRLSYTIKFVLKDERRGTDYITMPLECGFWTEGEKEFNPENKEKFRWMLSVMQPQIVTSEAIEAGLEKTLKKKGVVTSWLEKVRFQSREEGVCAQLVHVGPYEEKTDSADKLHAYIDVNNYDYNGPYHEIYIGDPRRAKPENLKTILRQPVRMKS